MDHKKNHQERRIKLFGTDGIRGKANYFPMSCDLVQRLGQAIGVYFREHYTHPRILIGKDTRRSGYMLEQALSSGICSVGVDTFFLGPLPTPGIAYLTRGMRANAGIVISASHNPFYDNGIKIFSANGYKLPDEIEEELEELIFNDLNTTELPTGKGIGTTQRIEDAIGQYAVFLKEQFPKALTLEGLRIVVDCAHGASYKVAPKVFEELGAEVLTVGVQPNGININDNCGALHPEHLAEKVLLYKANIGIALDGDADRLIVVDEKGDILDGDEILAICGTYYLKENRLSKKSLISTVMSNMGLDLAIEKAGGKVIRTQVGDRYVVETMRKGDYNLGGEQSGHLIFRDSSTTGDGILAALALLEIFIKSGKPLSEIKKCMIKFPQTIRSIEVQEKIPTANMPELEDLIKKITAKLGKEGRVLFRYSGTENKARIMVEGSNKDLIDHYAEEIVHKATTSIAHYINN